jgi:hypothetical protein
MTRIARRTSWLTQVLQADPEHARLKRDTIEYEFSAPGGGRTQTHEHGKRVFRGNYDKRGVYATQQHTLQTEDGRFLQTEDGQFLATEPED